MNKNIFRYGIPFAILYSLMVEYFGYNTAILTVLVMFFIELFIKE